jgi:hypothetical protein
LYVASTLSLSVHCLFAAALQAYLLFQELITDSYPECIEVAFR